MEKIDKAEITALILCGGQAQRMGGQDKGLILLRDKALVAWTIERCHNQVGQIILNANRHIEDYQQYGWPTLRDAKQDFSGPLAGFQVGLAHSTTPYVLVMPCDTPLFPSNLAEKLADAMLQNNLECTYAVTMEDGVEQAHPVFCLLKRSALESLNLFLGTGQRKIDRWFSELSHQKVLFDDPTAFLNINTPEELMHIEQLL
ncbi:molybdenum cofactor guanylyltransferase MobA [Polynucleobacter kasalickyi]|uniref:Molybdenum cofactor guanylyltransferase n=1 Tax=Polynucleobacter kasalickyi TaxID=1938817 RepID=A0A1W1YC13_9BURK|nr:molybdenum cofactor guanylyltransferase MobA [Polynucleobacter kasalickyi]SMC33697.1 molybdenum cofactor guanylyltransferase [Polynucleobacter kasalickyi]